MIAGARNTIFIKVIILLLFADAWISQIFGKMICTRLRFEYLTALKVNYNIKLIQSMLS